MVAETAKMETLRQRAELILEYEQMMYQRELDNPQWHPRYLHVLVPKHEVDSHKDVDESGIINGVKRLIKKDKDKIEALATQLEQTKHGVAKANIQVGHVKDEMKLMQKQMTEIRSLLVALQPKQNRLRTITSTLIETQRNEGAAVSEASTALERK